MNLVVFHYHLLPGGVTDVISNSLKAVISHCNGISTVRLVTGNEANAVEVAASVSGPQTPVSVDILPELGYSDRDESTETALARAEHLESILLSRFGGTENVWWVHNYHVGKNPAFTLALTRIAGRPESPRMLLHIHDFPECARYENLAYLTRVTGPSPYPAGNAVRYAVINRRDYDAVVAAGLQEDRVYLLVNPLPSDRGIDGGRDTHNESAPDRPAIRERIVAGLTRYAEENGQRFDPLGPLLLYPVRTIRRKNALEMAALARIADEANLVLTLPGVSDAERPYSDLVAQAYADGAVPGAFGIGRQESEYGFTFDDLTHGADAIVSSSVQEGFGLLFINALRWRVPLFARDLPVLDGVRDVFAGYPAHFYDSFQVPFGSPSVSSLKAYLRMRYAERLDALGDVLPRLVRERLDERLAEMLGDSSIDFAFLPPDMQYPCLRDLSDPGYAADVRTLNAGLIDALLGTISAACPDVSSEVEETFGFAAFAQRFDRIVRSWDTRGDGAGRYEQVQGGLVKRFGDLENLRLIFAPMGYSHE